MPFNPFSHDGEETSLEQGLAVNQPAKNVVKAANAQVTAQRQAANKAIIDQLYAPSTPPGQEEPGTDEANPQAMDHTSYSHSTAGGQSRKANSNPNQTPEEQIKMERIRHELFGNYSAKYKSAPNGPFALITDLDQGIEKARREREQQETQRKQEEEEEEKRKKEEEEEQKQEFVMPEGKKSGVMYGKKQQQPLAVRMAKTKTEINRGATG